MSTGWKRSATNIISSERGARSDELIEDRRWEIEVRSEPSIADTG